MIVWLLLGIALLLVLWGRREGIDETLQPDITEEEIEEYILDSKTNLTPEEDRRKWTLGLARSRRFSEEIDEAKKAAAAAGIEFNFEAWTIDYNKISLARYNAIEREAKKRLAEAATPPPPEPTPLLQDPAKLPPPPPEPSQPEDTATSSAPVGGVDEIKFQNEPNFAPLPPPAEMIPPRPELSLPSAPMPVATETPQPMGGNVKSIPISTADGPVVVNIYGSKDILSGKHNGSLPAPVGGAAPVPQQSA